MKIALVHDYLKEFGGAERVLMALHELWPEAPIYTAFRVKNSTAGRAFGDTVVIESPWAPLIKRSNLYSPLRFLAPSALLLACALSSAIFFFVLRRSSNTN